MNGQTHLKNTTTYKSKQPMITLREMFGFRLHLKQIRMAVKKAHIFLLLKQTGILLGKLLLYIHGIIFLLILVLCLLYTSMNPPVTSLMIYRKLYFGYDPYETKYAPLSHIPRMLQRMVVNMEDFKFYQHSGIDFEALVNAYHVNRRIGKIRFGGSTLTMQLARTLFLYPGQSYLRKYLEVLIALEMDLLLKKSRILELYLNYCEWGKGVYGIGAAASYHYGKNPRDLSTDECRRLVTILVSPLRYGVNNFSSRKSMQKRYEYLLSRFH